MDKTGVDVLALATAPAPRSLRWLPYALGVMALGLQGLGWTVVVGIGTTPGAFVNAGDAIAGVGALALDTFIVATLPMATLLTLAINTLRRRTRVLYWSLVGGLAAYLMCGLGLSYVASHRTRAPHVGTSVPPRPLGLTLALGSGYAFVVFGLVSSLVLLALPATRRALR